jgi:PAS domain S-box-containing protein
MAHEHTADALRNQQQQWMHVILSSIGDGVVTTDVEAKVTFLNPVAESLTGWSLADGTGQPLETVFKIVNEETRHTVENPAIRALRDGLVVGLANHTLLVARDGTERPIDDSAAPIRDPAGRTVGVVLVFRDVTERRRAELALKHSEERFRLLVEGTHDYAIFMLDTTGHIVSWNPGAQRIKGYTAGDIVGKHFSVFYPADAVAAGWPDHELKVAAAVGRFEDEGWRVRNDGSMFWANVVITALHDESGKLVGFSKITRDLSERREAEAKLLASERRYRRLFESARDGIVLIDGGTGKVIDANPRMSELLGPPHEELVGCDFVDLGIFADAGAGRAAWHALQAQGFMRYHHLPFKSRGGQLREAEFFSSVYHVDDESIIQCTVRDITERRQLERARVLAEASADLHRRKDEFLAMLSHELRNPLAPILNAVHMLRLQQAGETQLQQQARTIIERQVTQLAQLVNDLLEVSRITTGRIRLHKADVDIRETVGRAVDTVRPLVDERSHQLTVKQPQTAVWLYADPTRIEQVLVNLLNNAAKYTDEAGKIELRVEPEKDEVRLRVRDTGVGIPPDLLPRIFDLFTQSERSLDRSQGGLGIGLTLVQRLVEMHGGRVDVSSVVGEGSEFVVHLPWRQSAAEPASDSGRQHVGTTRPLRVLVVDENADAADSAALIVRAAGHDAQVAYEGRAVLESAERYRPDVVLLDIGLPECDGYEIAQRLRRHPELKRVRLIALTGHGQDADRHRARSAGFDDYLVKPVDPQKLQEYLAVAAS